MSCLHVFTKNEIWIFTNYQKSCTYYDHLRFFLFLRFEIGWKNCFLWIYEMSSSIRSQLKLCKGVLAWFLKWYFHYLPMACWSLKRSLLVIPCFQNSFFLTLLRPRLWAILRLRRLTALFASIIFKEILYFLYKNFSVNFNF